MEERSCKCLICQTEQELTLNLRSQSSMRSFQMLTNSFPPLATFASPVDLIDRLHRRDVSPVELKLLDGIFAFLIRAYVQNRTEEGLSGLLGLAFVPTLHKTFREVCVGFPALSPDDVVQQLFTTLFVVLRSRSIRSRSTYMAVAISALVRTNVLRWASRQTRDLTEFEPLDSLDENAPELAMDGNFETAVMLQDWLDHSKGGDLSRDNYELLLKLKVEGFAAKELAGLNEGLSPIAIHHRIHRIIHRLRRRASR
jgi:DNA-directed RNA polymerase specialized sigma24 family protein